MFHLSPKACVGCGNQFSPAMGVSIRQWASRKRCDNCDRENLKVRILDAVVIDNKGCWIWQQSTRNGYGQISVHDYPVYVHRLAHELFISAVPSDREVCHTCDVCRCCNPGHLFLGTRTDNMQDAKRKGRTLRGASHGQAVLNEVEVEEFKRDIAAGILTGDQLAAKFKCSRASIRRFRLSMARHNNPYESAQDLFG